MTEAAKAELRIAPRADFHGDAVWHFQAVVHTENPLRYFVVVDDQFDSYSDAATLVTRQYELYLDEQNKRLVQKFILNGSASGAENVAAPAGTRDPLAMLYELRSVDWKRTPEIFTPVYDGKRFYQMSARIAAAHDPVSVPAGRFDASRIAISVSSADAASRPLRFTLWLANDPSRIPVEADAEVPMGAIRGKLVRIE